MTIGIEPFLLIAASFFESMTPTQVAVFGLGALTIMMAIVSGRRRARNRIHSPQAYVRERVKRIEEEREVTEDAEAVMLRLEQFARELQAQINTHFARLESALRDAESRIRELQALTGHATPPGSSLDVVVDDAASAALANRTPSVPDRARPAAPSSPPAKASLRQEILNLAAKGKSASQIARCVNRSLGEVELTLAVHGGKAATATQA